MSPPFGAPVFLAGVRLNIFVIKKSPTVQCSSMRPFCFCHCSSHHSTGGCVAPSFSRLFQVSRYRIYNLLIMVPSALLCGGGQACRRQDIKVCVWVCVCGCVCVRAYVRACMRACVQPFSAAHAVAWPKVSVLLFSLKLQLHVSQVSQVRRAEIHSCLRRSQAV